MDTGQVADQLLDHGKIDNEDIRSYVDRLLLRIFPVKPLMQHLNGINVDEKHGKVQLVFNLLPQEVIPDVRRIIAVDNVKTVVFKRDADNSPYVGFEITLKPEMFHSDSASEKAISRATPPQREAGSPFDRRH